MEDVSVEFSPSFISVCDGAIDGKVDGDVEPLTGRIDDILDMDGSSVTMVELSGDEVGRFEGSMDCTVGCVVVVVIVGPVIMVGGGDDDDPGGL